MSADHSDVIGIQKRLRSASAELNNPTSVSLYAQARQVISYDSDRRKNLLAKYTVKYLKQGESATAAEAMARADSSRRGKLSYCPNGVDAVIIDFVKVFRGFAIT